MKRSFNVSALLLFCVLLFGVSRVVAAQEEGETGEQFADEVIPFDLGSQYFAIHAGVYFPLFNINTINGATPSPRQTIGGAGSIQWNIYLNSFLSLGIESSYVFTFSINDHLLSLWPTAAKISIAPRVGPFLIPVWLDVGLAISYFKASTEASLLLRAGTGFYWFFEEPWALGVRAQYWFIPQLHDGTIAPASQSRILNALTASLGVIYVF